MIKHFIRWFRNRVTPAWALFFFCIASFVQGAIVNGIVISSLTTLEIRFGFKSSGTAFIISAYHIAALLTLPVISYFGGKSHKPRWVGFGLVGFGIFSCLFALPHFVVDYTVNTNQTNVLCLPNNEEISDGCNEEEERQGVYLYYFIVFHALNGIACVPLFTLAVAYLDENANQAKSALFNGIFFSSTFLGSGVGFFIGGLTLRLDTFLNQSSNPENNPLWVGSWWLGFLIFGGLALLSSVPILMLPRKIKEQNEEERERERHQTPGENQHHYYGNDMHSLVQHTSLLFRNVPFLLLSLVASLDFFSIAGLNIFLPKYLESGFGETASSASFYMGLIIVFGSTIGQVLGGYLVFRFKLKVHGIIKLNILFTFITISLAAAFFLRCEIPEFVRTSTNNSTIFTNDSLNEKCLQSCTCNQDSFLPICGSNGEMYFSPCYAGCQLDAVDNVFVNCSCVSSALDQDLAVAGNATVGSCTSDCSLFSAFLAVIFFFILAAFFTRAPEIQATLRVVPYKFRSYAMGWQWSFIRLIGAIPGPLIYAQIFEDSCSIWSTTCGKNKTCRFYDNDPFYKYLFVLAVGQKGFNVLLMGLAYYIYKPLPEDSMENQNQEDRKPIKAKQSIISTVSEDVNFVRT